MMMYWRLYRNDSEQTTREPESAKGQATNIGGKVACMRRMQKGTAPSHSQLHVALTRRDEHVSKQHVSELGCGAR